MKTLATVLLISAISLGIFSQDQPSKYSFGVSFNSNLSDRAHFNVNPDYTYSQLLFNDHFKFGWTSGLFIQKQVSDRISLESGINFSNKGSATYTEWPFGDSLRDIVIDTEGKYAKDWSSKENNYYLDFPFTISYSLFKGPYLSYYLKIGLIADFYVAAEYIIKTNFNDGSQKTIHNRYDYQQLKKEFVVRRYNLSTLGAIGINYKVDHRFGIIFEPIFDINLFPLFRTDDQLVDLGTVRFYNLGLRVGIQFH
jgi:hypothetical protein